MKIYDLQDYWEYGPDSDYAELVASTHRQWENNNKKNEVTEAHYHSQLALLYSCMFKPEECRIHAALVHENADIHDRAETLVSVARVLVYEKKIEEALDHYQRAYALEPDHTTALEEAGWCCFELKRWKDAEDWFVKATVLDEDFETYLEGLGRSLAQQGKFEEALAAFKKALDACQQESFKYFYHHLVGQCYASLNDFYRALDQYTKCLDANPTYAAALNDMAALYFNQEGDISNSIAYLKKAEEAMGETGGSAHLRQAVYINLADSYKRLKEFELEEHYHAKLMEALGFGGLFGTEDDEDEYEDEYDDEEDIQDNADNPGNEDTDDSGENDDKERDKDNDGEKL